MREILFRGKVADEPDEWVQGYLRDEDTIFQQTRHQKSKCCDYGFFSVKPETVGQFVGNLDKNGKRIFEGDIVKLHSWWHASGPAGYNKPITTVMYCDDVCGFTPMCNYDCDCGVYHYAEECEVIGNIWDNKDLIGG